jgi:palmitoyltransferase ZDHHC13/17
MLQLSWTLIVLGSQLWQISRQLTTFELSNLGRYGFMGGQVGVGHGTDGHEPQQPASYALSADDLPVHVQGAHGGHGHRHGHSALGKLGTLGKQLPGKLMHLVGLDLYTRGRAGAGMKRVQAASNPFDHGLRKNCEDFWTRGRTLGVDYAKLYDIPEAGLIPAKRAGSERARSASKKRGRGQYEMVPGDALV